VASSPEERDSIIKEMAKIIEAKPTGTIWPYGRRRPTITLLMGSQCMIGLGLIAVVVLAEILGNRTPFPAEDDDSNYLSGYFRSDDKEECSYGDTKTVNIAVFLEKNVRK